MKKNIHTLFVLIIVVLFTSCNNKSINTENIQKIDSVKYDSFTTLFKWKSATIKSLDNYLLNKNELLLKKLDIELNYLINDDGSIFKAYNDVMINDSLLFLKDFYLMEIQNNGEISKEYVIFEIPEQKNSIYIVYGSKNNFKSTLFKVHQKSGYLSNIFNIVKLITQNYNKNTFNSTHKSFNERAIISKFSKNEVVSYYIVYNNNQERDSVLFNLNYVLGSNF